jgi:hypothetical protein
MQAVYTALFGFACFVAGWIGPGVVASSSYPGAAVRCIESGRICVGMPADSVLGSFEVEETLGGMIDLTCGYTEPGQGASNHVGIAGLLRHECNESKVVATFSRGGDLTNLWIDDGRIARIDRYPRHVIDL